MPILNIRALPQKENIDVSSALKKTCLELAKVFGCSPEQVWATFQEIKPGHYIEGEEQASQQPNRTHPPIIELIAFEGREEQLITEALSKTAEVLGKELDIPENIFLTYNEAKSGKVYTGGKVRYKN